MYKIIGFKAPTMPTSVKFFNIFRLSSFDLTINGNKVIQATKNLMNNKENVGITARANLAKAGTLPPSNAAREIASKYGIVYLSLSANSLANFSGPMTKEYW